MVNWEHVGRQFCEFSVFSDQFSVSRKSKVEGEVEAPFDF